MREREMIEIEKGEAAGVPAEDAEDEVEHEEGADEDEEHEVGPHEEHAGHVEEEVPARTSTGTGTGTGTSTGTRPSPACMSLRRVART